MASPGNQQLFDQYLKAWDLFNSELNRFWVRFNVFMGAQFLIAAALGTNHRWLQDSPQVGAVLWLLLVMLSLFTVSVVNACRQIADGILRTIYELEQKDASFILLRTYDRHRTNPHGAVLGPCHLLARVLFLIWVGGALSNVLAILIERGYLGYWLGLGLVALVVLVAAAIAIIGQRYDAKAATRTPAASDGGTPPAAEVGK